MATSNREDEVTVRGRLVDAALQPIAQADIQLRRPGGDVLTTSSSDSTGWFSLSVIVDDLRELFADGPNASVLVSASVGRVPVVTAHHTLTSATTSGRDPVLLVAQADPSRSYDECTFSVSGVVIDRWGNPVGGGQVRVYVQPGFGPAPSFELGDVGASGQFLVDYALTGSCDPESPNVTLTVEIMDAETLVASVGPLCSPASNAILRVVVPDPTTGDTTYVGPDEFGIIRSAVEGLVGRDTEIGDLTDAQALEVACRLGFSESAIRALVAAEQRGGSTDTSVEAWYAISRSGRLGSMYAGFSLGSAELQALIETAVEQRLLAPSVVDDLPNILPQFDAARVEFSLVDPDSSQATNLKFLLTGGGLDETTQIRPFLASLYANTDTVEAFWVSVRAQLGDAAVNQIQFSLESSSLTLGHAPLLIHLQSLWGSSVTTIRDLAKFSKSDWLGFLAEQPTGTPVGKPAWFLGTEDAYAAYITRRVEDAYPTEAVAYQLSSSPMAGDVAAFVALNEDFAFQTGVLSGDSWAAYAKPADVDEELLRQELRKVQRLFQMAPRKGRVETVNALYDAGFTSLGKAVTMGRSAFVTNLENSVAGGTAAALRTHEAAAKKFALDMGAYARLSPSFNTKLFAVENPPGCGDVDVSEIFGSQDFCECDPCFTVHSASAYFVDLLTWLDGQRAKNQTQTALDVLLERRPDLCHTQLSCENLETPLPSIDLVIEQLERSVAFASAIYQPGETPPPPTVPWPQTTWNASDLLAAPEHQLSEVYSDVLADAGVAHPWSLPFDLYLEEGRAFFEHLGAKRTYLLETITPFPDPDALQGQTLPADYSFAVARRNERVGLSRRQAELVTGANSVLPALNVLWGSVATSAAALQEVRVFLKQSGLTFPELEQFLRTRLGDDFEIDYAEDCSLDGARIVPVGTIPFDEAFLRSTHSFLRARRGLGWSIHEVDAALAATGRSFDFSAPAGIPSQNDAALQAVADVSYVAEKLKLGLLDACTLWGNLETRPVAPGELSYYERVVQPNASGPAFALNAAGDDIAGNVPHADVEPNLLGILRVDQEGLIAAYSLTGIAPGSLLTLESLSRLFRTSVLSRALGVTVVELEKLTRWSGNSAAFDGSLTVDISATLDLKLLVDRLDAISLSVSDLEFAITSDADSELAVTRRDNGVSAIELMTGLQGVAAEEASTTTGAGAPIETVRGQLFRLANYTQDEVNLEAIPLVEGTFAVYDGQAEVDARLKYFGHVVDATTISTLEKAYADRGVDDAARTAATDAAIAQIIVESAELLLARAQTDYVIEFASGVLAVPGDDARLFLENVTVTKNAAPITALEAFVDSRFWTSYDPETQREILSDPEQLDAFFAEVPGGPQTAQYEGLLLLERLEKAAAVASSFGWEGEQLSWIFQALAGEIPNVSPNLPLNLAELPTTGYVPNASSTPQTRLTRWRWFARAALLRNDWLIEKKRVFELVSKAKAPLDDYKALIAEITGQDIDELAALTDRAGYGYNDAQQLEVYLDAAEALKMASRLGIGAARLRAWGQGYEVEGTTFVEVSAATAADARGVAQSKHSPEAWSEIARPIRDQLRVKQRDALVDWLLADDPELDDEEDLLGVHLLDTQVSPCGLTSRLKNALSAVQLFVSRALMGLEPEIDLSDEAGREWTLMSRFRVWEANRKIFLWPENFLQPDLRRDKTELFVAFEDALTQSDANEAAIEDAFRDYLTGLSDVSRLEIVGLHVQRDTADGFVTREVVHVFARSLAAPKTMYYRQRIDDAYWTSWEKLPFQVDIGDVMPVVSNRRLFLFWPTTVTKRAQPEDPKQEKYTKNEVFVRLNYAEYVEGKWRGPKTTTQVLKASADAGEIWPDVDEPLEPGERKFAGIGLLALNDQGNGEIEVAVGALIEKYVAFGPNLTLIELFGAFVWDGCSDQLVARQAPEFENETARDVVRKELFGQWYRQSAPIGGLPSYQSFERFALAEGASNPNRGYLTLRGRHPNVAYDEAIGQGPDMVRWPRRWSVTGHRDVRYEREFLGMYPLTYQNEVHSFYVAPRGGPAEIGSWLDKKPKGMNLNQTGAAQPSPEVDETTLEDTAETLFVWPNRGYQFYPLFHPYICEMIRQLRRGGISALLDPSAAPGAEGALLRCQMADEPLFVEGDPEMYAPRSGVEKPYPRADFDFTAGGAMSIYNWEVFVYMPLLVVDRLLEENQFEAAQRWLHYIFDPTQSTEGSADCSILWKVKPLKEEAASETVQDLLDALTYSGTDPALIAKRADIEAEVAYWRAHPFDPHAIARMRPQAIQRHVVMKYLDMLIAWGDSLFRQDSIESNNEATQIYVIAKQLLGRRPVRLPAEERTIVDFCEVREDLELFGPVVDELQNEIPFSNAEQQLTEIEADPQSTSDFWQGPPEISPFTQLHTGAGPGAVKSPYFCIPPNEKMLGYWDTVDDRLFKLRNCLNIEGVFRQLPLFRPPIDPALIAKALAQGVDLASALRDINGPRAPYRFTYMLQLAKDMAGQVQSLGAAVLSAFEKRDAEALAQIRAGQQVSIAELVLRVREEQLDDAHAQVEVLEASRQTAAEALGYYSSRKRVSGREKKAMKLGLAASVLEAVSASMKAGAAPFLAVPKVEAGAAGIGPYFSLEAVNGSKLSGAVQIFAAVVGDAGATTRLASNQTALLAGWDRRKDDWDFQAAQAESRIEEIDRQITAAQLRVAIAEHELEVQRQQLKNSEEEEDYLTSKFTNQELYSWMGRQLTALHKVAFGLAVDVARRAERSYRYELGIPGATFISYDQWDSRREGLLAGEKLLQDLRRMEVAYTDANRREYELRKRVSLAELDPEALEELKTTGYAQFNIPDWQFDIDNPGHYFRRLRLASVTIPSVTGAFDSIGGTLSYLGGKLRTEAGGALGQDAQSTIESIALSTGQSDTGLFEPSFSDPRYLPFEYKAAGGSAWSLRLPSKYRAFDYRTISDVVLDLSYSARDGGVVQARASEDALVDLASGDLGSVLVHAVSVRASFPEEWSKFVAAIDDGLPSAGVQLELTEDLFPSMPFAGSIYLADPALLLWSEKPVGTLGTSLPTVVRPNGTGPAATPWSVFPSSSPETQDRRVVVADFSGTDRTEVEDQNAVWTISAAGLPPDVGAYQDLVLVFAYDVKAP